MTQKYLISFTYDLVEFNRSSEDLRKYGAKVLELDHLPESDEQLTSLNEKLSTLVKNARNVIVLAISPLQ